MFEVDQLFQYHSTIMDQQLQDILKPIIEDISSNDLSCNIHQEHYNTMDFFSQEISSSQTNSLETKPTAETQNKNNGTLKLTKRKGIRKIDAPRYTEQLDNSISSEEEVKRPTRHRRKRGEAQGYPTKNFLPNAKGPHIKYLQDKLGQDYVNRFQIIRILKQKDGISMKDYETLYNTPEFEQAFTKFFDQKVLYRELMISRSSLRARKIHMQKLDVFQRAFREKVFQRIN